MTTINLNQTIFAQLRDQYTADLEKDITYPLTYCLFSRLLDRNIRYEIKRKIALPAFITALKGYLRSDPLSLSRPDNNTSPLYEDDVLRVFVAKLPDPPPETEDSEI